MRKLVLASSKAVLYAQFRTMEVPWEGVSSVLLTIHSRSSLLPVCPPAFIVWLQKSRILPAATPSVLSQVGGLALSGVLSQQTHDTCSLE